MLYLSINEADETVLLQQEDRVLISLSKFPVAKLKLQLQQWMGEVSDDRPISFVYVDDSGRLTGALRIEPRPLGWQFTSCFERRRHEKLISLQDVFNLIQNA